MSRTLREAAQMALDALHSGESPPNARQHDAITALGEAMEAPEPEPVARCILDNGDEMGSVEWLVRPRSIRLDHGSLLYAAPPAAPAPAAPAAPVPDGWVMVPREPTPEMLAVVRNGPMHETWTEGYCAMIAASPAAPVVPLTDEQIRTMWKSSEFRGNGGQVDWFCEGIRAAEAHHGITGARK